MTKERIKTIAITGANGFIGKALVRHFSRLGWNVVAFVHEKSKKEVGGVRYLQFDLLHTEEADLSGVDVLVHTAYQPILTKNILPNPNLVGTKSLAEKAHKLGVKVVFFSTLSAHDNAESIYGKTKLEMEKFFDPTFDLVLRFGLVLGAGGGLFGNIADIIKKSTIVPLIGGQKPIQTIALQDVCRVVESGIMKDISGVYNIAHPEVITLRILYSTIAEHAGRIPTFVPIPIWLVYTILSITERTGLNLPFTTENVLGLKCLRAFDTVTSLTKFEITLLGYREALKTQAE